MKISTTSRPINHEPIVKDNCVALGFDSVHHSQCYSSNRGELGCREKHDKSNLREEGTVSSSLSPHPNLDLYPSSVGNKRG